MTKIIALMLILCLCLFKTTLSRNPSSASEECPLWNSREDNGNCSCSNSLHYTVICKSVNKVNTVHLKDCYCMTLDPSERQPVVGSCIYTCYRQFIVRHGEFLMTKLKSKYPSELNNETCGPFNRRGVLCSRCIEGYGLPVYSYNVSCVPCKDYRYNWLKYLAAVFFPLTVFVLVVIVLKVNVNSGSMIAYVTLTQILLSKNMKIYYLQVRHSINIILLKVLSFFSIWSLEFSRPFTSDLCLHPSLSPLQILALDYAVAFYPMVLVLLTAFVVYWHGKNQIVVFLCRPLYAFLHRFRRMWNVRTSLIEAFATLILLSYVEIMSISLDIITYSHYFYMNESSTVTVSADPSVEYMSKEHLPYFILACTSITLFNVMPLLLLCFYPCQCFHKLIGYCGINGRILNSFVDAFRGSYKLKPKYLQSFSAVYMLSNCCSIFLYYAISYLLYRSALTFILITLLAIVTLFWPHKNKWHNRLNTLLIYAAFLITTTEDNKLSRKFLHGHNIKKNWDLFNRAAECIGLVAFPLYLVCLICKYLFQNKLSSYVKRYCKLELFRQDKSERTSLLDSSFPYRLHEYDTNQDATKENI